MLTDFLIVTIRTIIFKIVIKNSPEIQGYFSFRKGDFMASSITKDKYREDKLRVVLELLKIREKGITFDLLEDEVLREQMLLEGLSEELVDIFIEYYFPRLVTITDSYQKQISDLIFDFLVNDN